MKLNILLSLIAGFLVLGLFSACNKDDDPEPDEGTVKLEITDAPIDDASIESTYFSIDNVKIGGVEVEDFEARTIDIMEYRDGRTLVLADATLRSGEYDKVTITLSNQDADGNSPGCYVLADGDKHPLSGNSINFTISGRPYEVKQGETTHLVLDFNLRKLIRYKNNSYAFSDDYGGVRLLDKSTTGTIEGNASFVFSGSDKVIVYAYAKGTYDRSSEIDSGLEAHEKFGKAITSTEVKENGDFLLHFLEQSTYELHFASYKEQRDGSYELNGTLKFDVLGNLDPNNISVNASGTTEINISVTGIDFL